MRFGTERLLTLGGAVLLIAGFVGLFLLFHRSGTSAIIGAFVGVLLIPLMAAFVRLRQRLGGLRILNYLDQSMRLHLPLPEFLRAAATSETKRPAQQLRAVSESLANGLSVGDALRADVPELPERIGWLLRAADVNDALPATLARLTSETDAKAKEAAERPSSIPLTYVGVLVVFMVSAVGFVAVFVSPKIEQIARDFGLKSTPLSRLWHWIDSPAVGIIVAVVFVLALLTLCGSIVSSADVLMGRFGKRFDPLRPLRDRVVWYLPWVGGLARDSNLGDVCQTIADALRAHRTFDHALREAAQPHLNRVLMDRVDRWQLLHLAGQTIGHAAQSAGMPSLISGMLLEHASADSGAAALEFLARHYRSRAARTRLWILSILPTALTFVFGAIVLTFSYLLYTSVWQLIDVTGPYKVGL